MAIVPVDTCEEQCSGIEAAGRVITCDVWPKRGRISCPQDAFDRQISGEI